MMRSFKEADEPEMKALIDQFEADGDIIYWRRFNEELRKRMFGEMGDEASPLRKEI